MKYINLFIFFSKLKQLNFNKTMIPLKLLSNHNILKENTIIIEKYIIDDPEFFKNFFLEEIKKNKEKFRDSIFWLHQKIGSYIIVFDEINYIIKELNIKCIFWMDDLHFARDNINNDERYINSDVIVSPSKLFLKNISHEFYKKTKFLFYFFDENIIDNYNPENDFNTRKNKIILSGKISSRYSSRKQMYKNMNNDKELFDIIVHPGYYNMTHEIYHINYYDELSKYKGALFGLANFPINFLLAKVIEILGSGCIGFFEYSEEYDIHLGLKEWEHYVPIYKENNKLNFNNENYKEIINSEKGKEIALNGYNYIKKNYNSITFTNKVIKIIKEL
jgi:hypothetical protein